MRIPSVLLLVTGALLLALSGSALAATHTVRLDGTGDFLAIQPAIDACAVGDTVLVGPGTYTGASNRNLDFHGVDLVLVSELGRDQTVIDCQELGRGFNLHSGETTAATINGVTVRNARIDGYNGGGVNCHGAGCSLRNARFEHCYSSHGGGCAVGTGDIEINSCEFVDCHGLGTAGALTIVYGTAEIRDVVFSSNSAGEGGAMRVSFSAVNISDCSFDSNLDAGQGGAISFENGSSADISGSRFFGNHGYEGGAISLEFTPDVTVSDCWFESNTAANKGGAIWYESTSNPPPTAPLIADCIFLNNSAEGGGAIGLLLNASPRIVRCTLIGNSQAGAGGGGIRCDNASSPVLEQVLIVGNPGGGIYTRLASAPALTCCDVWNNPGGNFTGDMVDPTGSGGNISLDPLLCLVLNPSDPYTLRPDSPCAPANNDCGVQIGARGVGCDVVSTEDTSWGAVKSKY